MRTSESWATRLFFLTAFLAALGIVGLGVLHLVGPKEPILSEEREERLEQRGVTTDADGSEPTAAAPWTLQSVDRGLVAVNHRIERSAIIGSLLNNTEQAYVNVQVGFEVYDANDSLLTTVRDTTSEIKPGGTWQFSLTVPPNIPAAAAELITLEGAPRAEH